MDATLDMSVPGTDAATQKERVAELEAAVRIIFIIMIYTYIYIYISSSRSSSSSSGVNPILNMYGFLSYTGLSRLNT